MHSEWNGIARATISPSYPSSLETSSPGTVAVSAARHTHRRPAAACRATTRTRYRRRARTRGREPHAPPPRSRSRAVGNRLRTASPARANGMGHIGLALETRQSLPIALRECGSSARSGDGRRRGAGHHDRAIRGVDHPARDASAEPPPARAQYDQPRAAEAGELDHSLRGWAVELLPAGRHPGALGCGERVAQRSLGSGHLGVEPALVVGLSEDRGRTAAYVDEDDRRAEPAGQRDRRPGRRCAARGRVNRGDDGSVRRFPWPRERSREGELDMRAGSVMRDVGVADAIMSWSPWELARRRDGIVEPLTAYLVSVDGAGPTAPRP